MADYLEFVKLWQAGNEEITRFLDKSGPLGFNVFSVYNSTIGLGRRPENIAPFLDELERAHSEENEDFAFWLDVARQPARDTAKYHAETPENIRREADTMRTVLLYYRCWTAFMESKDAARFLCDLQEADPEFAEPLDILRVPELAKIIEGGLNDVLQAVLGATTLSAARSENGFAVTTASPCLNARLWYDAVQAVVMDGLTPVICDRCGRLFMSARPWGKSCLICRKAAKARRNRERKAKDKGRTVRPRAGRPPKDKENTRSDQ